MLFTITGEYDGKPASITWEDGELSGHEQAVTALKRMAGKRERVYVPAMGTISKSDHLSKPVPAMVLLYEFLHPVSESSGEVPTLPEIPDGAVS